MNLHLLIGIAAAILLLVLVCHFVYQYLTTSGWSLTTAVNDSLHDLWIFFGAAGAAFIAGGKQITDLIAYFAGYPGFGDKFLAALPQQDVGIAGIVLMGILAYAHKKEVGS